MVFDLLIYSKNENIIFSYGLINKIYDDNKVFHKFKFFISKSNYAVL